MSLNPLAQAANQAIQADCPVVHDLLSGIGKALFFPKGILTQSAEAKTKATRFNATIGTATEGGQAMYIDCIHSQFNGLAPDDLYPYAPSPGLPALREAWAAKQREETPSMGAQATSLPVVTNALTHALDLVGELFLDPGDEVLMPDQLWGNYRLTWGVKRQAKLSTFAFFNDDLSGFNQAAFEAALAERAGGKVMVILNFPNNPTGYSPTRDEAAKIVAALSAAAAAGTKIIAVCDDAYYGMFYADDCETESLFGRLAGAHENLLAVKVDGATKEIFVWGLRVGFITFGVKNGTEAMYQALEQKTGGAIRGAVSNITRPGQTIVLNGIKDPNFRAQQAEKIAILRERADEVQRVVYQEQYADCWDVYPFNAGYFMCLRIKGVDAEQLRLYLLDEHGIGTISLGSTDLRVAFSCCEKGDLAELFDRVAQSVRALQG
ncbi:MAG: aminotransferase class I/II-fold pyridoxal phosphate-dependent enzyme [Planctomycetota bacterium]|jgi:aspartate/methionine/tyrosine aminotransferase|nr:aminotransferase class I/II-fold pyridoxal phosphate-dependent enzyme [Planctomycetota bacterium]